MSTDNCIAKKSYKYNGIEVLKSRFSLPDETGDSIADAGVISIAHAFSEYLERECYPAACRLYDECQNPRKRFDYSPLGARMEADIIKKGKHSIMELKFCIVRGSEALFEKRVNRKIRIDC